MSKESSHFHSGGWAWRPPSSTTRALAEGSKKIRAAQKQKNIRLFANQEHSHMTTELRIDAAKKEERLKKHEKAKAMNALNRQFDKPTKKTRKKTKAKADKPKTARRTQSEASSSNLIPLKKILPPGMDPKVARKKLRNAGIQGHSPKSRWEFDEKGKKQALKILAEA